MNVPQDFEETRRKETLRQMREKADRELVGSYRLSQEEAYRLTKVPSLAAFNWCAAGVGVLIVAAIVMAVWEATR